MNPHLERTTSMPVGEPRLRPKLGVSNLQPAGRIRSAKQNHPAPAPSQIVLTL